jgi:hypothetical protein
MFWSKRDPMDVMDGMAWHGGTWVNGDWRVSSIDPSIQSFIHSLIRS